MGPAVQNVGRDGADGVGGVSGVSGGYKLQFHEGGRFCQQIDGKLGQTLGYEEELLADRFEWATRICL